MSEVLKAMNRFLYRDSQGSLKQFVHIADITLLFALIMYVANIAAFNNAVFAADDATTVSPSSKEKASSPAKKESASETKSAKTAGKGASVRAIKSTAPFLRITYDDHKSPVALQTAIVRYRSENGEDDVAVDLVAAVHIGEKSYYAQLNREFAKYDAVLYELVAPEESRVPTPEEVKNNNHPLTVVQNGMKDMLGLEFQLNGIDYTAKNMVHADMSPDDFARSMEKRGESMSSMFMRMMGYNLAKQSDTSDAISAGRMLLALVDKNRSLAMKRIMAEQFVNNDGSLSALDGPDGSTLIAGRNQVVIDVLKKEIAAGKHKIAIFYGAAHMPGIQQLLHDELGMKPVETRWLTAWDLTKAESTPSAKPKEKPKEVQVKLPPSEDESETNASSDKQ
jgi:hypothetical protein